MKKLLLAGLFTVILMIAGGAGSYVYFLKHYWQAGSSNSEVPSLLIAPGTSSLQIITALEEQGLIKYPLLFRFYATRFGDISSYKAGEYAFSADMSPAAISEKLVKGEVIRRSVTLPEGWLSEQAVAILNNEAHLKGELKSVPEEGSLLPETYFFVRGDTRQQIVERMQRSMRETLDDLWKRRQQNLPLTTKQEALILASIVERETGIIAERERVAAVFINRLNKGMRLQSDPTANYGIYLQTGKLKTRLLRKDVDHVSSYNTYVIDGLPPKPICNPGKASLQAVLNPADTDELYFVADGKGGHIFSKTLEEHNRHVRNYHRLLRESVNNAK